MKIKIFFIVILAIIAVPFLKPAPSLFTILNEINIVDNQQPRDIAGIDSSKFVVLTDENQLILYSNKGEVLDIYTHQGKNDQIIGTINYFEGLGLLGGVLSGGRPTFKIEGNKIVNTYWRIPKDTTSPLVKKDFDSPGNISSFISGRRHCVSVDIEMGECIYYWESIKVFDKRYILKEHSSTWAKINETEAAVILYDRKNKNRKLYILNKL